MTINLGTMIAQLEACEPEATVTFDFAGVQPTSLASWRGVYSELAIGYDDGYGSMTAANLLDHCRQAIGKQYQGWKGGEYTMEVTTSVYVANPGEAGETGISKIRQEGYQVVIHTFYDPY